MISGSQVMPLLAEACPSYRPQGEGRDLLYVCLGHFAHHLLWLQRRNQTEECPEVALAIERLHVECDADVKAAATIGLLEGIQDVWSHYGMNPELFVPYLLPISAKWWKSLNDFWGGNRKFVGGGLESLRKGKNPCGR